MPKVEGKKKTKKSWSWTTTKNQLRKRARVTGIKEGEIWWCAVGENIGVEINGKNSIFERPVLVFSKISRLGFVGIPLTSQKKEGDWYLHFKNQGKDEYAALTQIRFFSVHRVYRRLGQIDDEDYSRIAQGLSKVLFGNDKNVSSLATGVCGRENPEYDSIISNQTRPVKTLIRKLQKLFRKRSTK
ncbi:type II toxin-antitoxin system PemK/MazF family toxin [Candidatus Saccharibacteria bacterium]|nr:type II toxin-antitoxin system PemK/MazF family toxin [Candidatus Saccharibacteria bacterium]